MGVKEGGLGLSACTQIIYMIVQCIYMYMYMKCMIVRIIIPVCILGRQGLKIVWMGE